MTITALPPSKKNEVPRGAAALAAWNAFHGAHVASAALLNRANALASYRAQVSYLNRSIAELEGTHAAPPAPAKATKKAVSNKKAVSTKKVTTARGTAAKAISA